MSRGTHSISTNKRKDNLASSEKKRQHFEARPKVSSEAAFKTRPKGGLRPHFYRGYRPGLGPRLKKCGLRLHGPIVARIRPRKKTRPNKPRPKAQRALGRVFRSLKRGLRSIFL